MTLRKVARNRPYAEEPGRGGRGGLGITNVLFLLQATGCTTGILGDSGQNHEVEDAKLTDFSDCKKYLQVLHDN